jgi:excisionase family DNA binding protein
LATERKQEERAEEDVVPPLIDIPTLAKRVSVPERHVRRLVAENRIPYLKWGHLVRFDPRQVEQWLLAAQVPARNNPPLKVGRPARGATGADRPVRLATVSPSGDNQPVRNETCPAAAPSPAQGLWPPDGQHEKTVRT